MYPLSHLPDVLFCVSHDSLGGGLVLMLPFPVFPVMNLVQVEL
ncbi:hypothetical protein RA11412_1680 [Rothia aeria]|uniref:Uncharacterized protein n=1 Tax=Rothia aeria TaxID=172042 RepID=A0A2Z5R3T7_9MICC|nr:hypothetical protein RA11412_1680 [Rothia aeria]